MTMGRVPTVIPLMSCSIVRSMCIRRLPAQPVAQLLEKRCHARTVASMLCMHAANLHHDAPLQQSRLRQVLRCAVLLDPFHVYPFYPSSGFALCGSHAMFVPCSPHVRPTPVQRSMYSGSQCHMYTPRPFGAVGQAQLYGGQIGRPSIVGAGRSL